MAYQKLFSSISIGGLTVRNRIFMPAMMLGFADMCGNPTKKLIDYYAARARGGVGLIITEITRVDDKTGATSFGQLALSSDSNVKPASELVAAVHNEGAKIFAQLHHPGRQNVGLMVGTVPLVNAISKVFPYFKKLFWKLMPLFKKAAAKGFVLKTVAPSKCAPAKFAESQVRALKPNEIKILIEKFVAAAKRAQTAGYDGVELHAAHGYLLQQFLSPVTNQREDEYGGCFENRVRFITEIIAGIKARCGASFPISLRLSVDECYDRYGNIDKGYSLDEGVLFAAHFERQGVAAVNVSLAGYDTFNCWLEPASYLEGWRKKYIDAVSAEVSVPVLAVNNVRHASHAEKDLEGGVCAMVGLGRSLIADPEWCNKVENGRENEITRCVSCLNCFESMQRGAYRGAHATCSANPFLGHEADALTCDGEGRNVVVVGAGAAGLSAALVLLKRGFKVTMLEKNNIVGGQLLLASKPPFKDKIDWIAEDLLTKIRALGGDIVFGVLADISTIKGCSPYAVVVATGGVPVVPASIAQKGKNNVFTAADILCDGPVPRGKRAVVIGSGMTGLETADFLAANRISVTVLEAENVVAPGQWFQAVDDIIPRLATAKVEILTGCKVTAVFRDKVSYVKDGAECFVNADFAVVCVGTKPVRDLCVGLAHENIKTYVVGDARKIGRIADATEAGYRVGLAIK